MSLKCYELSDIPHKLWGRTIPGSSRLFWSGSALEVSVQASELWVDVESRFSLYENWLDVLVNGVSVQHFMLPEGRNRVCLLRGMDPDRVREVRIVRDTQAMPDDPDNALILHALETDGVFHSVRPRALRLEFIGDSLTSGEGLNGCADWMEWNSGCFDITKSFPFLTARALDAEYRCISLSGWGVYCSWDGDTRKAIPNVYALTAPGQEGWDFSRWQPHAVIINLGTNDVTSNAPAAAIARAVMDFCRQVRRNNPGACILWAYGLCGQSAAETIRGAISDYRSESKDSNCAFLLLPESCENGSRQHPGPAAHQIAAECITARLLSL